MFRDRRLLHIYAIIFIDVIVGSAIGPVLPEFVKGHSYPQLWLALGTGLFLGVQLFSAPLLGKLSDSYGRRPIFIISAIGTFLADCLLLPVRLGSQLANRLSDGLTNGMYATVRSAITDISPKDELFKNLGIEGAIISLGFVIGPAAAGFLLTVFDVVDGEQARVVVLMAVILSALNMLLSWTLRETMANVPSQSGNGVDTAVLKVEVMQSLNVQTLWMRLLAKNQKYPGLKQLVLMQLALTFSTGYYFYFVTYASFGELRLDARGISYFFMYFGALSVVISYVFYTYAADRINQRRAIIWLAGLGAPVLAAYGLIGTSVVWLYILVTLDCLTLSLIQGLIEGLMAQRTSDDDRGEIFGINQALQGLASFGTTLVFGALSLLDLRLPFAWFAACLAMVAVMAWNTQQPKTSDDANLA
ncbi:MFS transporter [Spirosoma montaniterrae]|uniref:MFS transporter n=1 Tax=Spirosoma montaniterrae TaxID=1178516 RepID=A0A1P9WS21_9BACT|nr:MFS transporter [Spirosoma montaniterrae]AQG78178.1 MFS transporter [Spirosoma montaniterrae]